MMIFLILILLIIIKIIKFIIQIILFLKWILLIIINIIILITQIIIFRNLKPKNIRSWQMTQDDWVLTQDPGEMGPDTEPTRNGY